jgi:DNA-binding response OmpR family regulator
MINKHIPRILLVDSEPMWSKAVKAALEEQGKYHVQGAADIETALNFSYGNGFDLILINAALALDQESKFREIVRLYPDKVLAVSDVGSITTAIKVFKMGADYAEKPFEPKRVIELIASRLQPAHGTAS